MSDQPPVIVEIGTARVAQQRGRSCRNAPAGQTRINDRRADGLRDGSADRFSTSLIGFLRRRRRYRGGIGANYPVNLIAGCLVIPTVLFADQDQTDTGAALIAVVGT